MRLALGFAFLLVACSNIPHEEPIAGFGDDDGDGLTNGQEAELGTDPTNPDSDSDTYTDGDEVVEATDPLDPESRIYTGYWPYQPLKDDIADPGFDGMAVVGQRVPRFVAVDQFGDTVDLYDFAMHGKPVVLDLSAGWCGPCKEIAAWLEGEDITLPIPPELAGIPAMVQNGEVYWVTIYFQDGNSTPADAADAAAWFAAYPNEAVPVLADTDQAMFDWLYPGSYPSIQVVDEDMTLRAYDRYDYMPALEALVQ